MSIKRMIFMAVLVVAVAALAVPLVGLRASAAGSAPSTKAATARAAAAKATAVNAAAQQVEQQREVTGDTHDSEAPGGKISADTLRALGITRLKNPAEASTRIGQKLHGKKQSAGGDVSIQSGQPLVLNSQSALSAALITTIGGRDNQFSEVTLLADWDGREDCAADREQKVDDFSFSEVDIDQSLTRVAISEHTVANGFNENVYYYGDTLGNLWVGTDTNPGIGGGTQIDSLLQVNIPALVGTGTSSGVTLLNPIAGDCTDDQIAVTGIAVNPVADLGDFGLCGTIGEVVYVSTWDSEGCSSSGAGQVFRTRIFAFGFTDGAGVAAATPVGAIQILRNPLSNIAGVSVDDDGSIYFQLVDLIQFTGGAIFKVTETARTVASCQVNPRTNRVISSIPSGLTGGIGINTAQGTGAAPILVSGGYRLTNYSGPSTLFGNVVALASGGCNVLYAAVSRSFVAGDVSFDQLTQGLFAAPSAFGAAGTPSMVISFADCSGAFDVCSSPFVGVAGQLPVADGLADVAQAGLTRTPGVNNFRIFVQGNGPNLAPPTGGTAVVPGTPSTLLKIDMQVDYTLYSGLAVNEQNTVFVISGGTPAGIGKNPSPMLGEVLCFEDGCPADRRADFVDLRANTLPNPPASGGNVGDGDSDRFDHIFYQAPLDQLTLTPGGLAGLADGFLLYTNRVRNRNLGTLANLPNGGTQGDDSTSGVLTFEDFDLGHQAAGGDDQNTPFRGDDDNGAGTPPLVGPLSGGFEFVFGGPVGTAGCVWNGFYLNSNGNITFGVGDTSNVPTVPGFRVGPPRIAPAWNDLNPAARAVNPVTFPVQALGFANVNAFKVRWINVPQFGDEACTGGVTGGASNTFSATLFDDGTGIDENANQPLNPANPIGNNAVPFDLQEGPTDLRWTIEPTTGVIVGCAPRPEGSGIIVFDYCRMDLLGTEVQPVLTGYSIGGLSPLNPPGLCEINMSTAAAAADTNPFGVIQGVTANICANCCIGEGTEPTLFELFNEGRDSSIGSGGEITFATPDFDLRFEGNDAALCTAARQRDLNRGRVCLFGVGCAPPANPLCREVRPTLPVAVAPGQPAVGSAAAGTPGTGPSGSRAASPTAGIINALCAVQLNMIGCGFYPNETTIICQGFSSETGVPLQRPGKTVSSALTLTCDTNGDSIADAVIGLTGVTPVNCNLVRGTLSPLSTLPGTAFPAACCGGLASLTLTTTFSAGDNNVFGPFTRSTVCTIDLGLRAPVVFSATPSDGNCAVGQDLLISGACFIINGVANVTSVYAVDRANAANVVNATFVVLNPNLLDAFFQFGSANAGKTFLIFATGPNGTSRNLTTAVGCPLGNEQGIQVTFTCSSSTTPTPTPTPDIAVVTGCKLDRQETGQFFLDVTGNNMKAGLTATVGGVTPKKIKVVEVTPGTTNPTKVRLVKKICNGLPGNVIITNPGAAASQPFNCTERCPAQ